MATYTTATFTGTSSTQTIGGTFGAWWVPFTNRATTSGNTLIAVVSYANNYAPTAYAANGWSVASSLTFGSNDSGATVFTKTATGSDTLSVYTQFNAATACLLIEVADAVSGTVTATNTKTSTFTPTANTDPPSVTFNSTGDAVVIPVRIGATTAVATAAPSGYSSFGSLAATRSISWAFKSMNGSSEDPGAFTSASTHWAAFSISVGAVPEPKVTWNPADKNAAITLSNNDLKANHASGGYHGVRGTIGRSTGLYYFEALVPSGNEGAVGISSASHSLSAPLGYGSTYGAGLYSDGKLWMNSTSTGTATFNDVRVGFLVNLNTRRLWVRGPTGSWHLGGDPSAGGTGVDISSLTGTLYPHATLYFVGDTTTIYGSKSTITLGLPVGATVWGMDAPATTTETIYADSVTLDFTSGTTTNLTNLAVDNTAVGLKNASGGPRTFRLGFPTPSKSLYGAQTITWKRRTNADNNSFQGTYRLDIVETGSNTVLATTNDLTNGNAGTVYSNAFTFDASVLSDATGAAFEAMIYTYNGSNSMDILYLEWNATVALPATSPRKAPRHSFLQ